MELLGQNIEAKIRGLHAVGSTQQAIYERLATTTDPAARQQLAREARNVADAYVTWDFRTGEGRGFPTPPVTRQVPTGAESAARDAAAAMHLRERPA